MTDLRTATVLLLGALTMLVLGTTTFSGAVFTDSSTSTATVRAAADWTAPTAELRGTAGFLRGTVSLAVTASDADSAVRGTVVEQRAAGAGAGAWTLVCAQPQSSFSCAWETSVLPDGRYDVRVTATDTAGNDGSTTAAVTLDNSAPAVRLVDPGSPLGGTVRLAAETTDATSGVAAVELRAAPAGTSSWTTLCTATGAPWSCDADTRTLPYGTYDLQAVATDLAGNSATSARVRDRVLDNVVTTVTLAPVAPVLTGPVTLAATPTSTVDVVYVRLQHAPSGTSDWRTVCEVTAAPWTCSWDTTKVADGAYDVRAQVLDGAGRYTTSTVETGRRVQNTVAPTPPTGADLQAVNGPGTRGLVDAGDTLTLTLSCQADLRTVQAGWTGTPVSVPVVLRDAAEVETLEIGGLGVVHLNGSYAKKDRTLSIPATMRAGTVTVDGQQRTTVMITVGQLPNDSNGTLETVTTPTTLTWTTPAAVKSLTGQTCLPPTVTESGAADVDF